MHVSCRKVYAYAYPPWLLALPDAMLPAFDVQQVQDWDCPPAPEHAPTPVQLPPVLLGHQPTQLRLCLLFIVADTYKQTCMHDMGNTYSTLIQV